MKVKIRINLYFGLSDHDFAVASSIKTFRFVTNDKQKQWPTSIPRAITYQMLPRSNIVKSKFQVFKGEETQVRGDRITSSFPNIRNVELLLRLLIEILELIGLSTDLSIVTSAHIRTVSHHHGGM